MYVMGTLDKGILRDQIEQTYSAGLYKLHHIAQPRLQLLRVTCLFLK